MMKEVIRALDPGVLPQIALVAFLVAFTLILVWAFRLPAHTRSTLKNLPLNDPQQPQSNNRHG